MKMCKLGSHVQGGWIQQRDISRHICAVRSSDQPGRARDAALACPAASPSLSSAVLRCGAVRYGALLCCAFCAVLSSVVLCCPTRQAVLGSPLCRGPSQAGLLQQRAAGAHPCLAALGLPVGQNDLALRMGARDRGWGARSARAALPRRHKAAAYACSPASGRAATPECTAPHLHRLPTAGAPC